MIPQGLNEGGAQEEKRLTRVPAGRNGGGEERATGRVTQDEEDAGHARRGETAAVLSGRGRLLEDEVNYREC